MNRRERLLTQLLIAPRVPEIDERKRRFNDINAYVSERGGWITSPPGERIIRIECLVGSSLPDELADLGYRVTPMGEGQRMIPDAIVAVDRYEATL